MMKLIDILMILLFPILDSLPFVLPRYWLFRDRLRLPFRYIVLLQIILAAIYSAVFYAINRGSYGAAEQWTTITRYSFMLVYLLLAWQFFVLGNANFIESRYFWDFSDRHP